MKTISTGRSAAIGPASIGVRVGLDGLSPNDRVATVTEPG